MRVDSFLKRTSRIDYRLILNRYGDIGVRSLGLATPTDTGETAQAWSYSVSMTRQTWSLSWSNSNVNDGIPIVILLVYGHGARDGSFVQGRDFVNPVIKPILDKIADDIWKEITRV